MKIRNSLSLLFFVVAVTGSDFAIAEEKALFEEMDPTVSYSAWRHVESRDGSVKMREYHVPGKMRFDMEAQGHEMIMILNSDTGKSWMLMPEMKVYMQTSAAKVAQSSGGGLEVIERTELGKEVVNGYPTTKYKATFRDADGRKGEGYFWVTEEHGIPIKMDITRKKPKGRISMELTDLEVKPQPEDLFEVPSSYHAMPGAVGMGGMSGMKGGQNQGGLSDQIMQGLAATEHQKSGDSNQKDEQSLARLSAEYLEGCWWTTGHEVRPWTFHPDGSYELGVAAGNGYTMIDGGSVEDFRDRFDRLASKSDSRFVTYEHGRRSVFERGDCVSGNHSVAGPGTSEGNALDKAKEGIKHGIGSLF